jgi:hypothetical protein
LTHAGLLDRIAALGSASVAGASCVRSAAALDVEIIGGLESPPSKEDAEMETWWLEVVTAAFLAVLFLQSGIDKVVDRDGNLQWLTGHFAKSPLAEMVPLMLSVITGLELAAGVLSGLGAVVRFFGGGTWLAYYGAVFATLAILMLFFGQRLAKDYAGAAVLVSYFLLGLAALYIFA